MQIRILISNYLQQLATCTADTPRTLIEFKVRFPQLSPVCPPVGVACRVYDAPPAGIVTVKLYEAVFAIYWRLRREKCCYWRTSYPAAAVFAPVKVLFSAKNLCMAFLNAYKSPSAVTRLERNTYC